MIMKKEGLKEYWGDASNYIDFTQYISHTTFFILKVIQLKKTEEQKE